MRNFWSKTAFTRTVYWQRRRCSCWKQMHALMTMNGTGAVSETTRSITSNFDACRVPQQHQILHTAPSFWRCVSWRDRQPAGTARRWSREGIRVQSGGTLSWTRCWSWPPSTVLRWTAPTSHLDKIIWWKTESQRGRCNTRRGTWTCRQTSGDASRDCIRRPVSVNEWQQQQQQQNVRPERTNPAIRRWTFKPDDAT